MASETTVKALFCPTTLLPNSFSKLSNFALSPSSNFPTGIPVQFATTSATSAAVTSSATI